MSQKHVPSDSLYDLFCHGLLEVTQQMVERWIDERSKDLARTPYVSAEKIRADTRIYSQTLKYYGEKFLAEFVRRVERAKRKRKAGASKHDTGFGHR